MTMRYELAVESDNGQVRTIEAAGGGISVGDEMVFDGQTFVVRRVKHEIKGGVHTTTVRLSPDSRHAVLDDLLRYHILANVFRMDADQWVDFLVSEGSEEQIASDLSFASSIAEEIRRDPTLPDSIEMLVRSSSSLLFNSVVSGEQHGTQ